jgi:hypothetical protein
MLCIQQMSNTFVEAKNNKYTSQTEITSDSPFFCNTHKNNYFFFIKLNKKWYLFLPLEHIEEKEV